MVTSGTGCSMINLEQSTDHLNEALPRVDELGTKYVLVPSTNGDLAKIIGATFFLTVLRLTKLLR
jgi:IgGFc binding protein